MSPCLEVAGAIVCQPAFEVRRRVRECSTCKRRRRFVVLVFEWYDAEWTCCGCGDRWSGGYHYRVGKRRRAYEIAKAKARWKNAA